jgi:hypothetical protein
MTQSLQPLIRRCKNWAKIHKIPIGSIIGHLSYTTGDVPPSNARRRGSGLGFLRETEAVSGRHESGC